MLTGSSVDARPLFDAADAVVWTGYLGQFGGEAVAAALVGETNPSGRLPMTWYAADFYEAWKGGTDPYAGGASSPANASYFDGSLLPSKATGNPGRTYRYFTGAPLFKFGAGLSYSAFAVEATSAAVARVRFGDVAAHAEAASRLAVFVRGSSRTTTDKVVYTLDVTVRKEGPRAGATAVLVVASPPEPGVAGAPLESLVDFGKVHLDAGASRTVAFPIRAHDLTVVDVAGGRRAVAGAWSLRVRDYPDVAVTIRVDS